MHSFICIALVTCAIFSRGTLFVFQTTSNTLTKLKIRAKREISSTLMSKRKNRDLGKKKLANVANVILLFGPGKNITVMREMFGEFIFESEQKGRKTA